MALYYTISNRCAIVGTLLCLLLSAQSSCAFVTPPPTSRTMENGRHDAAAATTATTTTTKRPFPHFSSVTFNPEASSASSFSSAATSTLQYRDRNEHEERMTTMFGGGGGGGGDAAALSTKINNNKSMKSSQSSANNAVNFPMLTRLCRSQFTLLATATAVAFAFSQGNLANSMQWGMATFSFSSSSSSLLLSMLVGAVATVPMIAMSHLVDTSSRRDAHYVHFATTNMVVELFGRRHHHQQGATATAAASTTNNNMMPTTNTAMVLIASLGLVLATAIAEEMVFRGYIGTALWHVTEANLPLTLFGQGILFGLGHIHPNSPADENRLVVALQSLNGLWHGILYLATGTLIPCMVSHWLYDWHVLASTWHQVNNQMDYTEDMMMPKDSKSFVGSDDDDELQAFANRLSPETRTFLKRFYYAFDSEHKQSLSLLDVQRAVAYAFSTDHVHAPDTETVTTLFHQILLNAHHHHDNNNNDHRMQLAEFVQLLITLRATQQQQPQPSLSSTR